MLLEMDTVLCKWKFGEKTVLMVGGENCPLEKKFDRFKKKLFTELFICGLWRLWTVVGNDQVMFDFIEVVENNAAFRRSAKP